MAVLRRAHLSDWTVQSGVSDPAHGGIALTLEIGPENAAEYLRRHGLEAIGVRELGGGVSNTVLLVETAETRLVLKQALGRLRVDEDWLSDRSRAFRECAALRAVSGLLPPGSTPQVILEDRNNFAFAMSAAPPDAEPWKDQLMCGLIEPDTSERVARLLALMIAGSWMNEAWQREFGDQTVFDQLRLDPYYRFTAARHPDLAPHFHRVMEQSAARRVSLTHGDWSPKNFLVNGSNVMAIDFEVIHYGDPSFDAGFLLNHLLLKSFHHPQWANRYGELARRFWRTLSAGLPAECDWFEQAALGHLGCLLLARIDGKSPAEYLRGEEIRARVRQFARQLILSPPAGILEVFENHA